MDDRIDAEFIRTLRGRESRANFARRLGVTPLTVYRWELPHDAKEARRPRRAMRARIADLVRGPNGGVSAPAPAFEPASATHDSRPDSGIVEASVATHDAINGLNGRRDGHAIESCPDADALAPVFEAIAHARWDCAEMRLIEAFPSGRAPGRGGRALAVVAAALLQRLGRDAPRTAAATLMPALADVDALPPFVAAWVHATAALVHAAPDGRLLDLGRVHAHAAWVDRLTEPHRDRDVRVLARVAVLKGAMRLGERAVFERAFATASELERATQPAIRCLAEETLAEAASEAGRTYEARQRLEVIAARAATLGHGAIEARARARLALARLDGAEAPSDVLAVAQRARDAAAAARLEPGLHDVLAAAAEAEAFVRLGRFDDAHAALAAGRRAADHMHWPAPTLVLPETRLQVVAPDLEHTNVAIDRLRRWRDGAFAETVSVCEAYLRGLALMSEGALDEAAQSFDAAADGAELRCGHGDLEPHARTLAAGCSALAADLPGARARLRRAWRSLEARPSVWQGSRLRTFVGIVAALEGRHADAAEQLDTAVLAYSMAGDVTGAGLARRLRAMMARVSGDATADAALERTEAELSRLGMVVPKWMSRVAADRLAERCAAAPRPTIAAESMCCGQLVVPVERLALRGVAPAVVHQALFEVVREIVPVRGVSVEALDSRGIASPLLGEALDMAGGGSYFEYGDGCGRRYRLSVDADLDGALRAGVRLLLTVAGLSLEVATLHALQASSGTAVSDGPDPKIPGLVAASPAMRALAQDMGRLGHSRATVLIRGESGTGKEVVARGLHGLSGRRDRSYVTFNTAAVPRGLFEGHLFGYRKGASLMGRSSCKS